jgi:hypothetical protein
VKAELGKATEMSRLAGKPDQGADRATNISAANNSLELAGKWPACLLRSRRTLRISNQAATLSAALVLANDATDLVEGFAR